MVGDRGAWDGAATGVGMTAPILPAPTPPDEARSGRVLDPVCRSVAPEPGAAYRSAGSTSRSNSSSEDRS